MAGESLSRGGGEAAGQLAAAGATALQEFPGRHVVMADPEGNEFCVC